MEGKNIQKNSTLSVCTVEEHQEISRLLLLDGVNETLSNSEKNAATVCLHCKRRVCKLVDALKVGEPQSVMSNTLSQHDHHW